MNIHRSRSCTNRILLAPYRVAVAGTISIAVSLAIAIFAGATNQVPAFPGAEGFGSFTVAGRGGKIYHVSNLNDSGPGSFRSCAEAGEPRICVFRTGGLITLNSSIQIRSPYITIAGQSAPGGGVAIRTLPDNPKAALIVATHDVVIRYLRIRPGASDVVGDTQDAITIANDKAPVYNIVVDHNSFSWASDEVANVWYDAHDITFQWNIIAEGLHCMNHPHKDCAHSKGLLVGSAGSHSISIHHNLFAHHSERNPRLAMAGIADVVNNVIYNAQHSGSQVTNEYATARANYVNNYMKKGRDSLSDSIITIKSYTENEHRLHVKGNIGPDRRNNSISEQNAVKSGKHNWISVERHVAPPVTTYPCESVDNCVAYDQVLANSGALLPLRDAVDKRVIEEVRTRTGRIIDAQSKLACYRRCSVFLTPADYSSKGINDPLDSDGWPVLNAGFPYPDKDEDGMADDWEVSQGLTPGKDDSSGYALHNDYTNVEVFLNSLVLVK